MKFRTEIEVQPFPFSISHRETSFFIGSCFSQNMALRMNHFEMPHFQNPFGVTFNPFSIAQQLVQIMACKKFKGPDLLFYNQQFLSLEHHSTFNQPNEKTTLEGINQSIEKAHQTLKSAHTLFITLGTAWAWHHIESNQIVNNCHKIPAKNFEKKLIRTPQIVSSFSATIAQIQNFNPNLNIVFTVSPVRHWRNGALENSRSKALLLEAVYQLIENHKNIFYFPSYEIVMDDLRDYRFFEEDMLHPNKQAVNYIWQKFENAFFTDKTREANKAISQIKSMQNHRPFNPNSEEYARFLRKLEHKKTQLKAHFGINLL